jgi:hypothetical protein
MRAEDHVEAPFAFQESRYPGEFRIQHEWQFSVDIAGYAACAAELAIDSGAALLEAAVR